MPTASIDCVNPRYSHHSPPRAGTLLVFGTLYYQSFAKKDSKHGGHKENGTKAHGVGAAPEKAEGDVEAVKPLLEGHDKEEVKL